MLPRIESGRITSLEPQRGAVELESGAIVRFEIATDIGFRVGTRVLVTFGANGHAVRVGLDLTPLGMREIEASNLANVQARFDALRAQGPLTDEQRELFAILIEERRHASTTENRKIRDRIARVLADDPLPLDDDDAWSAVARQAVTNSVARDAWIALLALEGGTSKPTKKWLTAARAHVLQIGAAPFVEAVRRWFALVAPEPALSDASAHALRNLVWACATLDDTAASEHAAVAIGDLAVRCFTKIPGVGPVSSKVGNACIYVLSQLGGIRAVAQLSRLGSRLRYKQALALVDKAKRECARRAGVSPIDLEELSLPTFGLDVEGRSRVAIGAYIAELALTEAKPTLTVLDGARRLKSIPAIVKSEHAAELAELKATHKELAALVPTVRARLERWLFEPRSWSLADLRTRYLDHPLVARLARRLIYIRVDTDETMIFFDGYPLARDGKELALPDDARLALWHPIDRPAAERDEWRSFVASLEITQPFAQLDRELYLVGDEAAATESTRFAGRLVRQHQLGALLRERGWTYSLMGEFDGASDPMKPLPAYDLAVELELEVPERSPVADSGVYLQVVTGGIRFFRDDVLLALADVPSRCFSEVLRDIDLFVTAAQR